MREREITCLLHIEGVEISSTVPYQKQREKLKVVFLEVRVVPREWWSVHTCRPAPVPGKAAATEDQSWKEQHHCTS